MIELTGPGMSISYADGVLRVRESGVDRRLRLEARADDLLEVITALVVEPNAEDDADPVPRHLLLRLLFRDADFAVDGRPSQRAPFDIELPLTVRDTAEALVDALRTAMRRARRVQASRPSGPGDPRRDDLREAIGRLNARVRTKAAVSATRAILLPTELVLAVVAPGDDHLVTLTTERIVYVVAHKIRSRVEVYPLSGVDQVRMEKDEVGRLDTLAVDAGPVTARFRQVHSYDGARLVSAAQSILTADKSDGALAPRYPNSAELFEEWELLLERHQLGMVSDAEFQARGAGILNALP